VCRGKGRRAALFDAAADGDFLRVALFLARRKSRLKIHQSTHSRSSSSRIGWMRLSALYFRQRTYYLLNHLLQMTNRLFIVEALFLCFLFPANRQRAKIKYSVHVILSYFFSVNFDMFGSFANYNYAFRAEKNQAECDLNVIYLMDDLVDIFLHSIFTQIVWQF